MRTESRVWWLVGILSCIILIAFIFSFNIFGLGTLTNKVFSGIGNVGSEVKTKINTGDCPAGIIPEKIEVWTLENAGGDSWTEVYQMTTNKWEDGVSMERYIDPKNPAWYVFSNQDCREGSESGENVNYRYCDPRVYKSSKNIVDEQGNIKGSENLDYLVYFVLKSTSDTRDEKTFTGLTRIYENFEIVSSKCVKQ